MEKEKSQGRTASDESLSKGISSERLSWEERQRLRGEIGNHIRSERWGTDPEMMRRPYEDIEMQTFLRANPVASSVFDFELAAQLVLKGASLETLQMIIDSSPGAFRWAGQGWASVQPPCTNLVTIACISGVHGRTMRETLEIIKYLVAKFPDFSVYQDKENHDYVYDEDYSGAADHLIIYHLACWITDPPDVASRIEAMKLIHAIIPKAIAWAIDPEDGCTPLHRAILTRHDTTDMVVWLLETYPEMAAARTTDGGGYLPLIYGLRFCPAFVRKKCFHKLIEANPSALSEVMRTHIAGKEFDAAALHFLLTLGAPDGKGSYSQRTSSRLQTFGRLDLVQWVLEADLSTLSMPMVHCDEPLISPTSCMDLAKASACDRDDCNCARCNIYRTIQIVGNIVGSDKNLEEVHRGWDAFGSGDLQWIGGRKILFDACPAVIAAYLYRDGRFSVMPALLSYAGKDHGPGLKAVYDLVRANPDLMGEIT